MLDFVKSNKYKILVLDAIRRKLSQYQKLAPAKAEDEGYKAGSPRSHCVLSEENELCHKQQIQVSKSSPNTKGTCWRYFQPEELLTQDMS